MGAVWRCLLFCFHFWDLGFGASFLGLWISLFCHFVVGCFSGAIWKYFSFFCGYLVCCVVVYWFWVSSYTIVEKWIRVKFVIIFITIFFDEWWWLMQRALVYGCWLSFMNCGWMVGLCDTVFFVMLFFLSFVLVVWFESVMVSGNCFYWVFYCLYFYIYITPRDRLICNVAWITIEE